ncbi:hypothetical protein [Cellulomonas hominis]|nr:hypothetical protein AGMMS50218_14980 [Actinomycetota bacterium]
MTTTLKTVAAAALALALSLGASSAASAGGYTIQSGATGCCRMLMQ